jgi:hypothetical protein
MANSRSGHRPAGGIASRQHVEKPVKTGSGSKGISEGWVGQRGNKQGITHDRESSYRGEPKFTGKNFQPVKFGNEVALNVGKGGCGTGRTIHKTGSQDQHGAPAPGNENDKLASTTVASTRLLRGLSTTLS